MKILKTLQALLVGCSMFFGGSSICFGTVTPSDVFAQTEVFRHILDDADMLNSRLYGAYKGDDALRHPRHVMQKVRECSSVLSNILKKRKINSVPVVMPDLLREVRPLDVMEGVEHLIVEAEKLAKHKKAYLPQNIKGKVPSDVYNNLDRICGALEYEIVPSDVFQVAVAVRENIIEIARMRGCEYEENEFTTFKGKLPQDVYFLTREFLKDLRVLALNPDYAIPGGVVFAGKILNERIRPKDVLSLMNDAFAETEAMKYALSIRKAGVFPLYQDGKKPSDVFSQVDYMHRLIFDLKDCEEER